MRLFREYLRIETPRCVANGVRLEVIGRRDRLSPALRQAIEDAQRATAAAPGSTCGSRSTTPSRDAILRAAQCLRPETVPSRESFGRLLAIVDHGAAGAARWTCSSAPAASAG